MPVTQEYWSGLPCPPPGESPTQGSNPSSCSLAYSLGGLEVPMDNLVQVQVVHATGDAHGPVNQQGGRDGAASPQHLVQLALGAELHEDAVAGSLGAHTPGGRTQWDEGLSHPNSPVIHTWYPLPNCAILIPTSGRSLATQVYLVKYLSYEMVKYI